MLRRMRMMKMRMIIMMWEDGDLCRRRLEELPRRLNSSGGRIRLFASGHWKFHAADLLPHAEKLFQKQALRRIGIPFKSPSQNDSTPL